jgi:glycosyltransferase involved in cell wall biosynthesis
VKSNAGLYFENYFEFEGALNYMLTNSEGYARLCEGGSGYVDKNYRWDVIIKKVETLLACL